MENIQLIVRKIIGSDIEGFSRVSVTNELFNAVRGVRPLLPYTAQGDLGGNGVRIFNINGTNLYVTYNKETKKNVLLMSTEDAKKNLVTLADERANEPKLPFNASLFNVVATS